MLPTTSHQKVTDYEQHQLGMVLWRAHTFMRKTAKTRGIQDQGWVADFLSEQSEVVGLATVLSMKKRKRNKQQKKEEI